MSGLLSNYHIEFGGLPRNAVSDIKDTFFFLIRKASLMASIPALLFSTKDQKILPWIFRALDFIYLGGHQYRYDQVLTKSMFSLSISI